MVASCNHWSSDLRRWGKVRMENLGNHIHHGIKHIQPVNCSALNMTKCQSFRKFWHWELFRWDLLCNLTHQVYCAWLIKWVVKREIIQLTELCLTRWWIISGTWWYWVSIWRYWLVLDQYKLVLLDIRWYRVSKGLVCLYILEKAEIWSGDTDALLTDNRR